MYHESWDRTFPSEHRPCSPLPLVGSYVYQGSRGFGPRWSQQPNSPQINSWNNQVSKADGRWVLHPSVGWGNPLLDRLRNSVRSAGVISVWQRKYCSIFTVVPASLSGALGMKGHHRSAWESPTNSHICVILALLLNHTQKSIRSGFPPQILAEALLNYHEVSYSHL